MPTRNLPLNTWIVVQRAPSRERPALISTHDCQRAAEVECDRRNRASPEHPYRGLHLIGTHRGTDGWTILADRTEPTFALVTETRRFTAAQQIS
jgi:hypothetical protein